MEKGLLSAIKVEFDEATRVFFCLFHLLQAWYKKVCELKLKDEVRPENRCCNLWSIIKALPYSGLHLTERRGMVIDVLEREIELVKSSDEKTGANVEKLMQYLLKNYIQDTAQFDRNHWARPVFKEVEKQSFIMTNNAAESTNAFLSSGLQKGKLPPSASFEMIREKMTEIMCKVAHFKKTGELRHRLSNQQLCKVSTRSRFTTKIIGLGATTADESDYESKISDLRRFMIVIGKTHRKSKMSMTADQAELWKNRHECKYNVLIISSKLP